MFFLLSKTLNILTGPLVIICVLLLLSGILRNVYWKKLLFRMGLILLLLFSNDFIINRLLQSWEIPVTPFHEFKKEYAWGIVLTGVTKTDGFPGDRVYFNRGADRVTHTLQLYKLGMIKKILISGGSGKLIDMGAREADDMATALVMMGVPINDILVESTSRNTRENAVNSIKMLTGSANADQCLLISSAYHLRRARACFTKLGWRMDTFSTDFLTHYRRNTVAEILTPSIDALVEWNILIKELVGYGAYYVMGYV